MNLAKLTKITKAHAEAVYNIALEREQRLKEKYARKEAKRK